MIKVERLINDNGEIVKETQRELPDYFDEEEGYLFRPQKTFYKGFQDVPYPPGMTKMDAGNMAFLVKKIWANTNMLGVKGNGGVRALDIEDIAKALSVTNNQGYRFVEKMIKLGVLAKVKINSGGQIVVQYYVNPIHWFAGKRISLNLYLLFKSQLDTLLPLWVIKKYGAKAEEAKVRWGMEK